MMRKLTVLTLILSSSSIFADNFTGFYAGTGASLGNFYAKGNLKRTNINTNTTDQTIQGNSRSSWMANALVGYGTVIHNQYFLAGEFGYRTNTTNIKTTNVSGDATDYSFIQGSLNHQFNMGILSGFLANPNILLFGRLDALSAKVDFLDSNLVTTDSSNNYDISGEQTKYGVGFGLGARYSITNAFQVDLQAEHQAYQSVNTSALDNGGHHLISVSLAPQQNVIDLDLFYHF
jgi:opacity protein-like surface antigen